MCVVYVVLEICLFCLGNITESVQEKYLFCPGNITESVQEIYLFCPGNIMESVQEIYLFCPGNIMESVQIKQEVEDFEDSIEVHQLKVNFDFLDCFLILFFLFVKVSAFNYNKHIFCWKTVMKSDLYKGTQ